MAGRFWTHALLVLALAVLGVGGWLTIGQHRALSGAESVKGRLVEVSVGVTAWGTHRPRAVVAYRADGREREARRWSWMDLGGTAAWSRAAAESLAEADRSRAGVRVWLDPAQPGVAWLDPTPTAIPMVVWLGGVVLLGGWWGAWRASRSRLAAAVATPMGHHGWYGLRGGVTGGCCVPTAWAAAGTALLGGVPAIAHHYLGLGGPLTVAGGLAIAVWGGVSAWWIVRAVKLTVWSGRIVPPSVSVTRAVMSLEHDVVTRVKLSVRRPIVLRSVKTSLVCRRIDGLSATELYRASAEYASGRLASPGAPIASTHGFAVPPRKRRATLSNGGERIAWAIEVVVRPEYGPPITVSFPIDAAHETRAATPRPRLVGVTRAA
ncbi:MAG: hypothetical protein AAGI54_04625 [Planctomycetota bacterium]